MRRLLGISAFYHDSAACLLVDGEIVAAAQEERFSRKRHDAELPVAAIASCLQEGGLTIGDLDGIAFYDKPLLKLERLLDTYTHVAPRGLRSFLDVVPTWLKKKLWIPDVIRRELAWEGPLFFCEHHESHAASAFYPSPFDEAAVLTIDGVGEWATTTWGVGRGAELSLTDELRFPHSLGLLYSAFTAFAGFRVNSGEYKLMGLAPYGEARYRDVILRELIDLRDDGSFALNPRYFDFAGKHRLTTRAFDRLFDGPPRAPEAPLTQREMDLARSVQEVTEEAVLRLGRAIARATGQKRLCLAGGVALNCVANGRLLREGPFERLWIQPAAGDAGGAVGAALAVWHRRLGNARPPRADADGMRGALLGPAFDDEAIARELDAHKAVYRKIDGGDEALVGEAARLLAEGKVIGWFQGRMEFGPRALGARSILADPRVPGMQSTINLKVKFREGFRPFAPAVTREAVREWFELDADSPYMLLVAPVARSRRAEEGEAERALFGLERLKAQRGEIPAVTHVDGSARVQTVRREEHPRFHALLSRFESLTGCPVLVNTSFNVRGEPIVCRPSEAYACFMRTELDALVVGSFVLDKKSQPPFVEKGDWRASIALD